MTIVKKLGALCWRNGCSLRRLWRDEDATTSLEYALMLAFVALSAFAGYQTLGGTVSDGVDAGGQDMSGVSAPDDGGAFSPGGGPGNGNGYGHGNGHPGNGNGWGPGGPGHGGGQGGGRR